MAFRCDFEHASPDHRVPRLFDIFTSLQEAQDAVQANLQRVSGTFIEPLPGEIKPPSPSHQFLFDPPEGVWTNELRWRGDGSGGEPTGAVWWFAPAKVSGER